MSGHSKWSQIKRQKGRADVKRSSVFTKLSHVIALAARDGVDPTSNFKLRLAIEKARAANLPNDNIERAIQRGSGADSAVALEELTYEAVGPGGVALLITCLTDNRNRASSDVRRVLNQHHATFASSGSLSWQFESKGVIRISRERLANLPEELELALIDAGADDVASSSEGFTITTASNRLEAVRNMVAQRGIAPDDAGIELVPKTRLALSTDAHERLERLREELDAIDDVQDIFTNSADTA